MCLSFVGLIDANSTSSVPAPVPTSAVTIPIVSDMTIDEAVSILTEDESAIKTGIAVF